MTRVAGWAAAFVVTMSAVAVEATVVVPVSLRELVAEATLIARGRVTDVRGVAVAHGIESVATVQVASVLKGAADTFISVRVPGGQIGRYRFVMIDAPTFTTDENAIFFLRRDAANAWRPIGLSAGIVRIQTGPRAAQTVDPPLVVGRTVSAGQIVRGDARRTPMALTDFETIVRQLMAAPAATRSAR